MNMTRIAVLLLLLTCTTTLAQQGPEVTSWILNRTNETGFSGIPSNVQKVQYSSENVYVTCTCIPGYDIGPWNGNPNTPVNMNFSFRIPRVPQRATSLVSTPLGHMGVWVNGVSIFNALDARSYQNRRIWNQDALVSEGTTFDDCLGHPAPNGEYHHHVNPVCLYDPADSSTHSPIIGYAFDGYPIYGAFGYRDPQSAGAVTRMRSSYRQRTITARTTLPDGTVLTGADVGPSPTDPRYPLGTYVEDNEYVEGLGDLDAHNGRICITPEYPLGTYAYFVTISEQGAPVYPYVIGPKFRGIVAAGNTGPGSGHVTPTEPVETWGEATGVQTAGVAGNAPIAMPNPAHDHVTIFPVSELAERITVRIIDATGRIVRSEEYAEHDASLHLDVMGLAAGAYVVHVTDNAQRSLFVNLLTH
jgi:hypothetical protein